MTAVVSHPLFMAKPALGRGLGALLGGATTIGRPAAPVAVSPPLDPVAANGERVQNLALERIRPSPFQPRKDFSADAVRRLYANVANGMIEEYLGERRARDARVPLVPLEVRA